MTMAAFHIYTTAIFPLQPPDPQLLCSSIFVVQGPSCSRRTSPAMMSLIPLRPVDGSTLRTLLSLRSKPTNSSGRIWSKWKDSSLCSATSTAFANLAGWAVARAMVCIFLLSPATIFTPSLSTRSCFCSRSSCCWICLRAAATPTAVCGSKTYPFLSMISPL